MCLNANRAVKRSIASRCQACTDYTYEDDTHRQQYLEEQGWRVLRFSNEEVIEDVEAVAIAIAKSMGLKPTYGPHIEVRSGMRSRRSPNSKKGR